MTTHVPCRIAAASSAALLIALSSGCASDGTTSDENQNAEASQGHLSAVETADGTPITVDIGGRRFSAHLNDSQAARNFAELLPMSFSLTVGDHDLCGDFGEPLDHPESEEDNGWNDGELAYWTVGNDFVIFTDDEETSASTAGVVPLGMLDEGLDEIAAMSGMLDVIVSLDDPRESGDNASASTDTTTTHGNNDTQEGITMNITVNGRTLSTTMEDNVTTRAIMKRLPLDLNMLDLYGREMCYRFADELPYEEASTKGYEVGDIVYWPPRHSFVIMYHQDGERFGFQKLGHISEDITGIFGHGDVRVSFELD